MMMNCCKCTKEEKLRFAFKLFDDEDMRLITFKALSRVIQACQFAATPQDIEKKALMVLNDAQGMTNEEAINSEDFMKLAKKYNGVFFPSSL